MNIETIGRVRVINKSTQLLHLKTTVQTTIGTSMKTENGN